MPAASPEAHWDAEIDPGKDLGGEHKEQGDPKRIEEADDQPAAALPAIVVNKATSATRYDARCAIHEPLLEILYALAEP